MMQLLHSFLPRLNEVFVIQGLAIHSRGRAKDFGDYLYDYPNQKGLPVILKTHFIIVDRSLRGMVKWVVANRFLWIGLMWREEV